MFGFAQVGMYHSAVLAEIQRFGRKGRTLSILPDAWRTNSLTSYPRLVFHLGEPVPSETDASADCQGL